MLAQVILPAALHRRWSYPLHASQPPHTVQSPLPACARVHVTCACSFALDANNSAAQRVLVHRLLDFLLHLRMPHKVPPTPPASRRPCRCPPHVPQEAEHSAGSITDKLSDSSLLLTGSVNDAALTKLLRLGYIRDVMLQEWKGEGSPHTLCVAAACASVCARACVSHRVAGMPVCCVTCWREGSCRSAPS